MNLLTISVFDLLTTGIALWKLAELIRAGGGLRELRSDSFGALFMRSGVMYFIVITIIQLAAVIMNFRPQSIYNSILNDYTITLSCILVARFLLDVRALSKQKTRMRCIGPTIGVFITNASGHLSTLVADFEADSSSFGDVPNLEIDMDEVRGGADGSSFGDVPNLEIDIDGEGWGGDTMEAMNRDSD